MQHIQMPAATMLFQQVSLQNRFGFLTQRANRLEGGPSTSSLKRIHLAAPSLYQATLIGQ